jgi:spore germination cell wall hydrolase CwlJ-like protein
MILDDKAYQEIMLALLIWREARSEPYAGQVAVACTVRDRVVHPKWWGNDYISVITKKWQYSSIAAPNDQQLILYPQAGDEKFKVCLGVASGVIAGILKHPMPSSDSYYATYIPAPDWATPDKLVGKIGQHNFYNIDGETED